MVVSSTFQTAAAGAVEIRLVVRGCLLSIAKGSVRSGMLGTAGATIMERMMGASGTMFGCCWLLSLIVLADMEQRRYNLMN
eukprot:scaffold5108_cov172-Amphora_coffeaeformis.AAC.19